MAVALDVTGTPTSNNTLSTSFNYTGITVGATANALVFCLNLIAAPAVNPTCTWDSGGTNQAMTLIGVVSDNTNINGKLYFYGLLSPTAGNLTLAVSWTTTSSRYAANAISFIGVNTTFANAFTNFASTDNTSTSTNINQAVNLTSPGTNYAVGAICIAGTVIVNSESDTLWYDITVGTGVGRTNAQYAAAPIGSSHTFNWVIAVSTFTMTAAFEVQPATAATVQLRPPHITKLRNWPSPPPPLDGAFNPNVFTNPYPFNQYDFPLTHKVPQAPRDLSIPLTLLTNPFPFLNLDTRGPQPIVGRAPVDVPFNPDLKAVITNLPFNQYDFSVARRPNPVPLTPDSLNPNLFLAPFPFNQYDFPPPHKVPRAPFDLSVGWTINFPVNPYPIFNPDSYQPKFQRALLDVSVPYNINQFGIVVPPLPPGTMYDFAKPVRQAPLPNQDQIFNLNLFTNPYPVLNLYLDRPRFQRPLPDSAPQPYNSALYFSIVASPFNQYFWPAPFRIPPPPLQDRAFNPNLERFQFPFNQYSYPLVSRVPRAPFDLSVPTNPTIYPGALIPTLNINYVPVRQPLPTPLDTSVGFRIMGVPIVGVPTLAFTYDRWAFASSALDYLIYQARASTSPSGQNWSGAGYMAIYEIDTEIQINGDFINSLTGVYIDPTLVTLFVINPNGVTTSFTFPGTVTRASLGHYFQLLTPTVSGVWTYKWQATGSAICTSPDTTFTVNPSLLIAG